MVDRLLGLVGCHHEDSLVVARGRNPVQGMVRWEETRCQVTPSNSIRATASGATTAACRRWVGCLVVPVQEAWPLVPTASWRHLADGTLAWDHPLTVVAVVGLVVRSAIRLSNGVDLLLVTGVVEEDVALLEADGWVEMTTVAVVVAVAVDVADAVADEVVVALATLKIAEVTAPTTRTAAAAIAATADLATVHQLRATDRDLDREVDETAERVRETHHREAPVVETLRGTQAGTGIVVGTVEIAVAVVIVTVVVLVAEAAIGTAAATESAIEADATEATTARAATAREEAPARRSVRTTAIRESAAIATKAAAATTSGTTSADDRFVCVSLHSR